MKKNIFALTLLLSMFSATFSTTLWAQKVAKEATVKVEGEVLKTLSLTLSDFAKLPHAEAIMKDRDGQLQHYSGVPVFELLKMAGVTLGKELKGENLTKYMLVRSSDGYEVVFSLAELDPVFTNRVIILADQKEGKPLADRVGPFRLVVPDENRPARSVLEVSNLIIRFAKE